MMKKILLFLLLTLGMYPVLEKGKLQMAVSMAQADSYGGEFDPNNDPTDVIPDEKFDSFISLLRDEHGYTVTGPTSGIYKDDNGVTHSGTWYHFDNGSDQKDYFKPDEADGPFDRGDGYYAIGDKDGDSGGGSGDDPGDDDPGDGDPGGGSGGDPGDDDPGDDDPGDNEPGDPGDDPPLSPYNKIKAIINDPANATYMQKVRDLATPINLDLGYEKSVALIQGANPNIKEASGTTASPSVPLPDLPSGQKYKVVAHTHPNATEGTYSVFSFGDLRRLSGLMKTGQLDHNNFVAFLSTKKGTHYAFTITDKNKFEDFFYYFNNNATVAQGNVLKMYNSQIKANGIEYKYFNDPKTPLIKQTDTDNNHVLSMFLDFMKEADLGITLFETNANFSTFSQVGKQANGDITRTPVN